MTSIQLEDLALVTGGRGGCQLQQQQQQQQAQPQTADPTQAAAAPQQSSGGFMQGFDQFLSFLQSDNFKQILGGIQGLVGSFSGGQQQQAAPTQSA